MREGIRVFTQAFGKRPIGCWPSEGAVSDETLKLIERFEFRWTASSANVLRASLTASDPRDSSTRTTSIVRTGSPRRDSIVFSVKMRCPISSDSATPRGAAMMPRRISCRSSQRSRSACKARPEHAVLIALDGENAWEHYPFNGYFFLNALYAALAAHPALELTTLSQCVARGLPPRRCRAWSPAAGSTGRLRRGWAILRRMRRGSCCARRNARLTTHPLTVRQAARKEACRRAAARPVREFRLVLVVRRLQSRRCGNSI